MILYINKYSNEIINGFELLKGCKLKYAENTLSDYIEKREVDDKYQQNFEYDEMYISKFFYVDGEIVHDQSEIHPYQIQSLINETLDKLKESDSKILIACEDMLLEKSFQSLSLTSSPSGKEEIKEIIDKRKELRNKLEVLKLKLEKCNQ